MTLTQLFLLNIQTHTHMLEQHPSPPPQQLSIAEYCDRIKYQHDLTQSQYNTLKIEAEKLKTERNELQSQSKRFFESAYYLNVQNHKLAEINGRLLHIIHNECLPHLTGDKESVQQRVMSLVEEAKKVSVNDLEKRIQVSAVCVFFFCLLLLLYSHLYLVYVMTHRTHMYIYEPWFMYLCLFRNHK